MDGPDEDSFSPLSPLVPTPHLAFPESGEGRSNSWHHALSHYLGFGSSSPKISHKSSRKSCFRRPAGWRQGASGAAALIFVILAGNIILAAVFKTNFHPKGYYKNIAAVRTGDCREIKNIGVVIHLVINIISTLLVGATNYCMQTVSAPTRHDIDEAHARGLWVDIGIPSVRNMWFVRKRRLFSWLVLGLTSIPLHLVYNSIFFVSTNNSLYNVWFADESFSKGAPYGDIYDRSQRPLQTTVIENLQDRVMNSGRYERLSNNECIKQYAKELVESRGDVVLVIDPPENCLTLQYSDGTYGETLDQDSPYYYNPNCRDIKNTSLYAIETSTQKFMSQGGAYRQNWYYWICSQYSYYAISLNESQMPHELCSDGAWKKQLDADPWIVKGAKVNYCLSDRLPDNCHIKVATNLLYVVIAFNAVKLAIVVLLISTNLINDEPIVTVGDAVASFIESPDLSTKGMCLRSAKDIILNKDAKELSAIVHQTHSNRWFHAVSIRRRITASLVVFIALTSIFGLFGFALVSLRRQHSIGSFSSVWSIGMGRITPFNLITGWNIPRVGDSAVASIVLIANLPQVLCSFLYIVVNGLITSMTAAAEWSSYAHKVYRPLRVSFPKVGQRSTFFLQMPYRYSVPVIILSILMHWLISQSIFMVQIAEISTNDYLYSKPLYTSEMDEEKDLDTQTITTAAFSPVAICLSAIVLVVVFLGVVGLGRFRLKGEIPLAGSCSLAIAAACHASEGTSNLKPLGWGVVLLPEAADNGVGHCAFSNEETEMPEPGKQYA